MALTRKMLKDLGIESEVIDKIIEEHRGTVDSLRDELDSLKTENEANKALKKEIEGLKAETQAKSDFENKYNELTKEFEKFKADIEGEKITSRKSEAYKKALKEAGISEKRIESVLKLAKVDGLVDSLEFDGDNIKDADKVTEAIKSNYAEYIESVKEKGAEVPNPPVHGNPNVFSEMSLADKMAYANANPNDASVISWLKGE